MNRDPKTEQSTGKAETPPAREPYTPPVIEKFPPIHDVAFGSSIVPASATGPIP